MKKPLTTRRRKALRWCAAAIALLAAVWVLLPRNLTLEMVHERAMEDLLAAPTETLRQTQALLERNYEEWLVLAQSRDAVCLGVYQKAGWLNWRCQRVPAADREEGRPFAAGHYYEQEYVCLAEALPLLEEAYGPEHPKTAAARERLSKLHGSK